MDTKEWKELKHILSSLLISSPLQLTVRALNNDFRNEIGTNIPYQKFGFRTLEQCLDNMTDVLQQNGGFVNVCVSSKSAHIDKLVSKQMMPSNRRSRSSVQPRRQSRRHTLGGNENYTHFTEQPCPRYIPPLPFSPVCTGGSTSHIPSLLDSNFTCPARPPQQSWHTSRWSTNFNTSTTNASRSQHKVHINWPSDNATLKSIENTLKPANSECQLTTNTNIKVEAEPINKKPDKEDITIEVKNDQYVVSSGVPLDMQKNLILLINKFDKGIWCAKLPETYRTLYKKELDYAKYGFKNLVLMCMELEKIFYCYRPNKADFILYNRMKPLPEDFEEHFMQQTDVNIKPTEVETIIKTLPQTLYPLNVLQLYHVVQKQFISCDIKKDDFIDVCVVEIYHPRLFFIILAKYSTELDKLMDDMQSFYVKRGDEFRIPPQMISPNLYCVTLYDNEYHRAKIIEVLPEQTVKVFCFDYGTVDTVKSSGLCYLHKRFAGLPQQAIEARLAGIRSSDSSDTWVKEASLRFLDLTKDKDLVAHVFNVERVRQRLDVFLADTTGQKDMYMNDTLVREGYAVFYNQNAKQIFNEQSNDVVTSKNGDKPRGKAFLKTLVQMHARKKRS